MFTSLQVLLRIACVTMIDGYMAWTEAVLGSQTQQFHVKSFFNSVLIMY